ncbi:bifunctional phosphoribosylaminoimidazolecarboxamide formyltransferase/inosine monophosphate cyclohydrolase [Curtobacterium sp. MCJR17_055]|uniref:bifunctional phosphoribosylaminoimidazolecarboxamide formyltransferase/IMP cyclohydrolase n=1 Tax=unclassified Curtobacterium TaxID=257496 RepID=UPI000D9DFBD6|nr:MULTISPECIES: bifunctional phosphoribosylaminoimidazolecarboxamide formyltransferase/IMP cyclohydrolase [unclassified Curtobacterium]PYY37601.1 bifunctional phosphoribosylaminoimidazolecarboxamide formyltransferase/inosine monophosphate cyclohydrolase [Curtobacterium sp. MCBD17_029]PYY56217.1 bifunctional phosphoribosylaminoimidazolecarboxamide formyltransferase/inosine monophosphate cyclohydrolase [Curtobacterium sp. MCPF17_015]PYY56630.1 bifunctional phosphoribosylaminoimidazolecarboxamide 
MSVHAADPSLYRDRDVVPVRRALISVSDKSGLLELAGALADAGVELVSTGSTAQTIRDAGYAVTDVASVTGFPESLDGRVKTLHPAVHAGLLADLRLESHEQQLTDLGIAPFELVVVNLYPFVETVASGADTATVVENVDIGGPAMVRASAKNHPNVAIVVSPASYAEVVEAVRAGGTDLALRKRLAAQAFGHTAAYDTAVAAYFASDVVAEPVASGADDREAPSAFPEQLTLTADRTATLRYGENAHQSAALYTSADGTGIAQATQLHGKEMSYNNYVDADAAVRAAYDFAEPAVAIIKHANPCGIAVAAPDASDPIASAHAAAHACDPLSAFGGVIAANRPVTLGMAETIADIFTEVVVAPAFDPEALEVLSRKKNIRLLTLPGDFALAEREVKQISGGFLVQDADRFTGFDQSAWTLVSGEPADEQTLADLAFAWKASRAVKSNAILLANQGASVGVGMGQVNRVDSCHLAVNRAGDRAAGSVAASDAFFPFADGLQVLLDAGVRAVAQPGGSVRDDEVIAAATAAGVTMYFTGERHFFH